MSDEAFGAFLEHAMLAVLAMAGWVVGAAAWTDLRRRLAHLDSPEHLTNLLDAAHRRGVSEGYERGRKAGRSELASEMRAALAKKAARRARAEETHQP